MTPIRHILHMIYIMHKTKHAIIIHSIPITAHNMKYGMQADYEQA